MRMTNALRSRAQRAELKDYSAGLGEFSLEELIRFAELSSELCATAPKAFHEMWQCMKDEYSVKMWTSELVRLGMPNSHPWLNDPESLRVAKEGLPFFYTERLADMRRILELRRPSIAELVVGKITGAVVRGPVPKLLKVRSPRVHSVARRAPNSARRRRSARGKSEPQRGAPQVGLVVDRSAQRRCAAPAEEHHPRAERDHRREPE